MKFIKIYAITLVLCFLFVFFGGWMLFEFSKRFWLTTAVCALIIAVFISVYFELTERIETLEQKVKALEETGSAKES